MPLTPKQRLELANIIASAEMAGAPLDEETKHQLELIMLGELDVEVAIANVIKQAQEHSQ
ncbi:MAG: hypothetical protein Q4A31_02100 [Corynebacterium sp.]|uniref:hypothetical protein n=1 Tax=Corynebacterium sp. TaxID=1720 RepID=UPI0026DD6C1D|nr:hypothetical protein [Corynebacterium sp.]MDO4760696.1 hypothetical protein [Corynebacterium sp.]